MKIPNRVDILEAFKLIDSEEVIEFISTEAKDLIEKLRNIYGESLSRKILTKAYISI